MPSIRSYSSVAAVTLLVAAATCADNITQGNRDAQASSSSAPTSNVSNSNAAAPTLNIQSTGGIANVFSGPANPPMGASYFTIEVDGAGFPAGESSQSMLIGVRSGSKTPLSTGIGPIPPDGTHREIYSASCPSGFSEVYSVVQTGGRTTESKHIVPAC